MRAFVHAILVGTILCLANLPKPLHVDDPAYYQHAAHLARHPLKPYDFNVFWYEYPEPANTVLLPPVLAYWLAVPIRLFGLKVVLWKLWLLPFCLIFALALETLFHHFAAGLEVPLLWMTVLSPAFLPSLNLMPDIPALSLTLAGLVLFLTAIDRQSSTLAIGAGVLTALAMQTKYTAFSMPVAMLVAAAMARRPGLWLISMVTAIGLFSAWEAFVYAQEGASHFIVAITIVDAIRRSSLPGLGLPLLTCIGAMAPGLLLLALIALGAKRWLVMLAAIGLVLAYGSIGWVELPTAMEDWATGVFAILGTLIWAMVAAICVRLMKDESGRMNDEKGLVSSASCTMLQCRPSFFLIGWLAIEIGSYFSLSPFPAVRRTMAILVIMTLLAGRLAVRYVASRRGLVALAATVSVVMGSAFGMLDWWEARVRQQAAYEVSARIRSYDSSAPIWYTGHWGLQFYAEELGMKPVIADGEPLRKGDWLVLTLGGQDTQQVWFPPGAFDRFKEVAPDDHIPFSTIGFYLAGAPLTYHTGPRVDIGIGRMNYDCPATSDIPPERVVQWAAQRNWPVPAAALASVKRAIDRLAGQGPLAQVAVPWLRRLAAGSEPLLADAARQALEKIETATAHPENSTDEKRQGKERKR
jgi:hypothetical protein